MDYTDLLLCHYRGLHDRGVHLGMGLQAQEVSKVCCCAIRHIAVHVIHLAVLFRSFAIAAAMFMNSNSLPIALMQSLVVTVPGLKWGSDDSKNAMVGRALTYLVLYSTLGMILRWSYGVRLLSQADPETTEDGNLAPPDSPLLGRDESAFPPSSEEYRVLHREYPHSDQSSTVAHGEEYPTIVVHDTSRRSDPKFFYSFPNTPSPKSQVASGASSSVPSAEASDAEEDDTLEFPVRRRFTEPTSTVWQSRRRRIRRKVEKVFHNFTEFMTVPLWAALMSLVVACIPPLQHMLDEHVQPIKGALTQAGNCSIPLTLVVLGAYFYSPPDPEEPRSRAAALPSHRSRDGSMSTNWSSLSLVENVREMFKMRRKANRDEPRRESKRPGETKTVVISILARMIITPVLLLPIFALSTRLNLQEVFDEYVTPCPAGFTFTIQRMIADDVVGPYSPVFVVSNVLLIASPPAITLAQVCLIRVASPSYRSHTQCHRSPKPRPATRSSDSSAAQSSGHIAS